MVGNNNTQQRKLALLGGLVAIVGLLLFLVASLIFPGGPPAATLRLGDTAVQGSLSSYCWRGLLRGICRDSSPPQLRPAIARVVTPNHTTYARRPLHA
ncbi:MAG: hypothetical protein MUD01_16420 [Chloroflexaceae bacterium]|jgi:hypothetical protein|nr:hypothetical protein [Chloroflexaceae bacterium]